MISGSCHCGAVTFEISGPVTRFEHCHCQTCRKINGTAFGSSAVVDRAAFRVTRGEDSLSRYRSSPEKDRFFCPVCGSHVFALPTHEADNYVILRVGTLDPRHGLTPESHIYVEDKPDWYEILDGLPQHRTEP